MDEQQQRINEIRARLAAVEAAKGYCQAHSAMHVLEANAPADLRFLLDLVEQLTPKHVPGLLRQMSTPSECEGS